MKKFKIISREGKVDMELSDGQYHVDADIIIKDGQIKYIDNGIWTKGYKGKKYLSPKQEVTENDK